MTDGVLHLVNRYTWYDMIERGEKPEEYRDIATWKRTICVHPGKLIRSGEKIKTDVRYVCFHRGYTNTTMTWSVEEITAGRGNPKWGAPDKEVFIIKLKRRVK